MTWKATQWARERLARERGAITKDWGGRLPVALVYPNSYHLGMSSLGLQTLYGWFNADPRMVCERVFYAPELGPPLSVESQRPLADFGLVAFSISYELDYWNVVQMLRAAGIPIFAEERDERHPLVIAGGPCLTANPEPLAPFFDAIGIGEGEALLPPLTAALEGGGSRAQILDAWSKLPGIYVPVRHQAGQKVVRQWVPNLDVVATTSVVLTPDTELADIYLMEVARGCGRGCHFCLAGYHFRPMRARSVSALLDQAQEGLKMGRRLGLVGAAVGDHPHLEELVLALRQEGAELSVSSLRLENLSAALLDALAQGGARSIALAPESGTERLRRRLRKSVTDQDIRRAVDLVAGSGLRQLKLYFMLGLPGETEEDVDALVALAQEVKGRLGPGKRLELNVSPFVPKAGTPFQRQPMALLELLQARAERIRRRLRPLGIGVEGESPAWSRIQGLLSRGERRLAQVLARVEENHLAAWEQALAEEGLNLEVMHQPLRGPLPWEMIISGVAQPLRGLKSASQVV